MRMSACQIINAPPLSSFRSYSCCTCPCVVRVTVTLPDCSVCCWTVHPAVGQCIQLSAVCCPAVCCWTVHPAVGQCVQLSAVGQYTQSVAPVLLCRSSCALLSTPTLILHHMLNLQPSRKEQSMMSEFLAARKKGIMPNLM